MNVTGDGECGTDIPLAIDFDRGVLGRCLDGIFFRFHFHKNLLQDLAPNEYCRTIAPRPIVVQDELSIRSIG